MKETKRKDRVAAFVCYLVAIGAAAIGWPAVMLICLFLAVIIDPPVRRK